MKIQQVQRIHGLFLIVLALGLAIYSTVAEKTGWGVYGFLHEMPWGQVGLIQAYLLMSVIGFSLYTASKNTVVNKIWDVIGILAHIPPLVALVFYGYLFFEVELGFMIWVSIAIHATWITLELLALIFIGQTEAVAVKA